MKMRTMELGSDTVAHTLLRPWCLDVVAATALRKLNQLASLKKARRHLNPWFSLTPLARATCAALAPG